MFSKSSFRRSKKGSSVDNFFVMISFFTLAVFFLAMAMFWNTLNTQADDLWSGSPVGNQIRANMDRAADQYDWMCVVIWFAFHMGILITSFLLKTHPVMYIVAIILICTIAMVAAPISNAWVDMTDDPNLSAAALELPKTNFIMSNLPVLEIIWGLISAIVLFGLARKGELL